jgi:uncharacterized protein (TIGR02246 family)
MKQTLIALTGTLLLACAGCTQAPPAPVDTSAADMQAIKDAVAAEAKDVGAKQFDKMASYYADDAVLMTNGAPPASGKAAIQGMTKMLADMDADLKFEATKVDVAKSGELGYAQGTYTIATTDPKTKKRMMEKGTFVSVLKKQADGSWKLVQDINTPDSDPVPVPDDKSKKK